MKLPSSQRTSGISNKLRKLFFKCFVKHSVIYFYLTNKIFSIFSLNRCIVLIRVHFCLNIQCNKYNFFEKKCCSPEKEFNIIVPLSPNNSHFPTTAPPPKKKTKNKKQNWAVVEKPLFFTRFEHVILRNTVLSSLTTVHVETVHIHVHVVYFVSECVHVVPENIHAHHMEG